MSSLYWCLELTWSTDPQTRYPTRLYRLWRKFELILLFCVHIYGFRRNEVVLEAGEKYRFNEDGSEMTLLDVAKLDEGEYTCIAKNKAGESEQELSLRVFGEQQCSAEWQFKCFTCGAELRECRRGRNNHLFCERLDERCCSTWVELISCEDET